MHRCIRPAGLAQSDAVERLRAWLVRELFRYLGHSIEYAMRWDRPYPAGLWSTLHELYADLVERNEAVATIEARDDKVVDFDPETEYKRLLLIGLARQRVPADQRSPWLFTILASLAKDSRLKHPEGHRGEFDLTVVEISKDEPPHRISVVEYELNGWIFVPAKEFYKQTRKVPGSSVR